MLFLLSAAELSVALIAGALVSSCVCEFRPPPPFALLCPPASVVVVEDAMTLLLKMLLCVLLLASVGFAESSAGVREVDDMKALGCIAGWWFRGSSFPTPTPFLPARALFDTRSRFRSMSWKKRFLEIYS